MFLAIKTTLRRSWVSSIVRLTALLMVVFAAAMIVTAALTVYFVSQESRAQVDEVLAQMITADEDAYRTGPRRVWHGDALHELPREMTPSREGYATVHLERDGHPIRGGDDWRVLLRKDDDDWILAAVSLDDRDEIIDSLMTTFRSTSGIAIVIVGLLGALVAWGTQRRLGRISQTLDQLARGDLRARVAPAEGSDDIAQLSRHVNRTADQLETLVSQSRNLGANLAHDLRTPLARLMAHLEQLEGGDAAALDRAHDEAAHLSETFSAILRIARVEAAQGDGALAPVALGALAQDLADIFGPVVEDQGKGLQVVIDRPATVLVDRDLLVQAFGNLIQNAIVYGGDMITLRVQGAEMGVLDNGAGVPEDQLDSILLPMVRLDRTRQSDGAGLGLSMVRAVAGRHEAALILSNQKTGGLSVTLTFTKM